MGRPSKHRLQTTASLRQRDVKLVKLAEDSDENGWHGQLGSSGQSTCLPSTTSMDELPGKLSSHRLMMTEDQVMLTDDRLMMTEDRLTMQHERCKETNVSTQRSRSFSSDASLSLINSDSNSSLTEMSPDRPSAMLPRDVANCYVGSVSVKTEREDVMVSATEREDIMVSAPSHSLSAATEQFTVSWPGRRGPSKKQHVLSGGYCCERAASPVAAPVAFVADNFCSSPTYVVKTSMPLAAVTMPGSKCESLMADDSDVPVTCSTMHNTCASTVESADDGVSAAGGQSQVMDSTVSRLLGGQSQVMDSMVSRLLGGQPQVTDSMVSRLSGGQSQVMDSMVSRLSDLSQVMDVSRLMDMSQAMDVSPGSKWHIASDRDSPYVSVMALASSCHLFSESCPTNTAVDDDNALVYDQTSSQYWLEPDLPDENVIFTEKHCEMINQITAAYDRYVQTGTIINETLVTEMKVSRPCMWHFH